MSNPFNNIHVGLSANLIKGLNSDWNPASGKLNILYSPSQQCCNCTSESETVQDRGQWQYPVITLHESVQSLLTELIPYEVVNPSSECHVPTLPAGALVMGGVSNKEAVKQLSETIGVDLSNPDYRYALVKLTRKDGSITHASVKQDILIHYRPKNLDPNYGITEDFNHAMIKLRHSGKSMEQDYGDAIRQKQVTSYLDHFKTWGTHFVSQVDVGDTIMQVFAYPSAKFKRVKKAYSNPSGENSLEGSQSVNFVYYTTDLNKGEFGFVKEYGQILNLSNSSIFRQTFKEDKWLETTWSKTNSVFALFSNEAKLGLRDLQEQFQDKVPIRVQLSTMTLLVEFKRALIWQRVISAAFVQKYQSSIEANFKVYDTRDFVAMLPEDQPGLLSTIGTPRINVYKTRIDIGDMQFVAPEEVNDFTLFANVLSSSASGTVKLPGNNVRLFGQVLDMRPSNSGQPKTIMLNDAAYDGFEVACSEFLGALAVRNQANTKYNVIVDGLKYGLSGEGRDAEPIVVSDVRQVPPVTALPSLVDSLQFSMTFAEAVVSNQAACPNYDIQILVRNYLQWIAKFIPAVTENQELLILRVRALDLAHYATDPSYGSFVPILPSTEYEKLVEKILNFSLAIQQQINEYQQQIEARRQEELVINVANTLNENIIESGKLLSNLIAANAKQQKDMADNYDSLITQQKAEAEEQNSQVAKIEAQLFKQQAVVNTAVQTYKTAVQQWETIEAIKFGLDVATNVFSLGTSILIPSSSISAVKDLGKMAQLIQKTLNVLNASWKLYSGIQAEVDKLKDAQKTFDGLDGAQFGSPSSLSWDEMSINFDLIIATGPSDSTVNSAKAELQAAFKTLILRGKALTTAKSALHQIQRDIYTNQQQKEINDRQAKRLDDLKSALRPAKIEDLDKSKIDLIGLTGNLVFIQNQMLTILAKAFLMQDQALQYANLQPATAITSFSLLKFYGALVTQQQTTIEAKSKLGQYQSSTTNQISYVIDGVSPTDLINDNRFSFCVHLDAREFYQYVNARVVSVVAEIDGIQSTDSGKYLVQLTYQGTPFNDRDTKRKALTFRTPWRERVYEYNIETGTRNFSDGGVSWSEGVSPVTPFSSWQIALPNTETNKGITFKNSDLRIRLSFVLKARIVDKPMDKPESKLAKNKRQKRSASASFSTISAQLSVPDLVSQLNAQGSCTNGWDVVFNMSLEQINKSLEQQYEELKNSTTYKNIIQIQTKKADEWVEGRWLINKFGIEYGYPLLSFSSNNPTNAKLTMEILSGNIQKCMKDKNEDEKCKSPTAINGETLTANIKIGMIQGTVQTGSGNHNVLKVQLDMQTGTFDISNIDLSDDEKIAFNLTLKAYFVNNPVLFLINQLDLTQVPTLDNLKPKSFYFKPLKTPSGKEMLQLFIQTGNRNLLDYTQTFLNNISEPIPLGAQCTLMVKSGLFFNSLLPESLNKKNWKIEGIDPVNDKKAWTAKFTQADVSGNVDLTSLNSQISGGYNSSTWTDTTTYYIPGGNTVTWSLAGMTIEATNLGKMKLSGNQKNSLNYIQKNCRTTYSLFDSPTRCTESKMSTDVSVGVLANLPLGVGGSGREQTVYINIDNQAVTITGHMSGGGPSSSDDLQAQVNQKINSQVPSQIVSQLNVSFQPISVFALKNLLFPSNNYINFSAAYVPGDLLIVGTFSNV
ncbi:hypothetical protein [Gloeothece verrucosa]|uniref:MACPF domain-containing protein n=1 Tax=Gloeothece verrucosa (strain PCC 7822) TaxID=497965 RepID=E0UMY5_GLOV7|nr:hypothetical protein [Gloeothece verrucosa]ADN18315.1 conserved hypothetical protein [Gloeothece verrucosa PCC 7822]